MLIAREFAMRFTSTPRGARLARRLVSHRLNEWGHPYTSPANERVTLIAAELAANAVRHGHVPGRDFRLRLAATGPVLRVEVADTRAERLPVPAAPHPAGESGYGLLLVAALADDWGVAPRPAAPGKTVWAEVRLPAPASSAQHGACSSPSAPRPSPICFTTAGPARWARPTPP
ncbi:MULTISPECIES: ATP-binding protein [unclassified Streptomyces]|uniref:ATP-binding protein n=1 Tax=unclassified Streptomyces TaxID=2593676 RepID=UPI0033AD981F